MTFQEYQDKSRSTALYPNLPVGNPLAYLALGLTGESGEIADKIKKLLRDKQGVVAEEDRIALLKECGDVLWYLAQFAHDLGSSLEDVAEMNVKKLAERKAKQTLQGSGDTR